MRISLKTLVNALGATILLACLLIAFAIDDGGTTTAPIKHAIHWIEIPVVLSTQDGGDLVRLWVIACFAARKIERGECQFLPPALGECDRIDLLAVTFVKLRDLARSFGANSRIIYMAENPLPVESFRYECHSTMRNRPFAFAKKPWAPFSIAVTVFQNERPPLIVANVVC